MHPIKRCVLALALCATSALANAQLRDADPDWKENDLQAIPAFDVSRLIEIDMGQRFSLVYAIDPQTLSVGSDGILRFVMVARSSSGAVNAFYEGLRCSTAEGRVYARHNPSSDDHGNGHHDRGEQGRHEPVGDDRAAGSNLLEHLTGSGEHIHQPRGQRRGGGGIRGRWLLGDERLLVHENPCYR